MSADSPLAALERQVAMLERAAGFLADDRSAVRCDADMARGVARRMTGNGLRELDIFLTDIIAEARLLGRPIPIARPVPPANDPYHHRRIYCAAEAYRRSAPGLGWRADHYGPLKSVRAVQNRMAFQRKPAAAATGAGRRGDPFVLAGACAVYIQVARDILGAARGRSA